jgi:hypothetical protein
MSAVLPKYKLGPANYQAAGLIFGGQLVVNNNQTAGTTDLTVRVADGQLNAGDLTQVLGVAAADANVIATQTGAANAYGEPLIDLSVLGDYVAVYYGHVDIWTWYSAAVNPGQLVQLSTTAGKAGTLMPFGGTAANLVGRCTHPGGVAAGMLTQQIGGQGSATFFLGRARITV